MSSTIKFFEAYENQRRYPLSGFSTSLLPTDRWGWSNKDGRREVQRDNVVLPPGYTWESEWTACVDDTTDHEGWTYAFDFPATYHPKKGFHDWVRRRRWVRKAVSRFAPSQAEAPEEGEDEQPSLGRHGTEPSIAPTGFFEPPPAEEKVEVVQTPEEPVVKSPLNPKEAAVKALWADRRGPRAGSIALQVSHYQPPETGGYTSGDFSVVIEHAHHSYDSSQKTGKHAILSDGVVQFDFEVYFAIAEDTHPIYVTVYRTAYGSKSCVGTCVVCLRTIQPVIAHVSASGGYIESASLPFRLTPKPLIRDANNTAESLGNVVLEWSFDLREPASAGGDHTVAHDAQTTLDFCPNCGSVASKCSCAPEELDKALAEAESAEEAGNALAPEGTITFHAGDVTRPGRLAIKAVAGQHLLERSTLSGTDPFIRFVPLSVGGNFVGVASTRHITRSTNPVWNETVTIDIEDATYGVRVEVWDHSSMGAHNFLGEAVFDVPEEPVRCSEDMHFLTLQLQPRNDEKDELVAKCKNLGTVSISFWWTPYTLPTANLW